MGVTSAGRSDPGSATMSPKSDVGEWLSDQYRKDPGLKQRVNALVEEMT
jgi:hypothetical protein